jgi:hypothetical protein
MALESATYINGLVTSNPASTDGLAAADDHLRLLKSTVKASFPGVTGAVNSTHTELNVLDGIATGLTATELNVLDGITSSTAELNVLDGIPSTLTATELGYVDGVTSALQTQMDAKTPASRTVSAGSGMTGGGALTGDITLTHADTSTQVSVDNSGTTFVQDVTLDTYGHVTGLTSATVPADTSIGVNQSWQDVKANRTTNTYYENDTGRVIMVSAAMLDSAGYVADDSSGTNEIMIAFDDGNSNTYSQLHMLIPAGKYYKCGSGSIHKWTELR